MTLKQLTVISLLILSACQLQYLRGATGIDQLDFKEVFEVLRANVPGMDEQELNRVAARGLISQLRPRVMLLSQTESTNATASAISSPRATAFEKSYGYFRPGQITAGSGKQFTQMYGDLATNRLKGLLLDLRFSGGDDYAAAAAIADSFFSAEQPLIDYGDGLKKSTVKDKAITLPVAILVNRKTAGAAEALAGILRHNDIGLLVGENTGGQASIARNFTLKTGQTLRVATTPIKTGNGNPMPASGLKPDINVEVNPDDEFSYVEDIYKDKPVQVSRSVATNTVASSLSTNLSSTNRNRRRLNEAELVRMLRDGQNPDGETNEAGRRTLANSMMAQDPALARALDLLKGLAVVQQTRRL